MFQGKIHESIQLLSEKGRGSVLRLNDHVIPSNPSSPTVLSVLKSKHPQSQHSTAASLIEVENDPFPVHPVIYDEIDANCIRFWLRHALLVLLVHPAWVPTLGEDFALLIRSPLMISAMPSLSWPAGSVPPMLTPHVFALSLLADSSHWTRTQESGQLESVKLSDVYWPKLLCQ